MQKRVLSYEQTSAMNEVPLRIKMNSCSIELLLLNELTACLNMKIKLDNRRM